MKPRRTASGVATITVITKPHPCSSDCLYCPRDVRMPKSYLSDEPACQRAERCFFDPYLQVSARLRALAGMGHATDKVELIVLGGTFTDYPRAYQTWFVHELFRALNDGPQAREVAKGIAQRYRAVGIANDPDERAREVADVQALVNDGACSFNQAIDQLYGHSLSWRQAAQWQTATDEQLAEQQRTNEHAASRVVGLVVETRPDAIGAESLALLRRLGCTKVQVGIQSLDDAILARSGRKLASSQAAQAFSLLRAFGFKIHAHYMLNLPGALPEGDMEGYRRLATDPAFAPDEVKLYPCVLLESAPLAAEHRAGRWAPYDEDVLVGALARMVLDTPPYLRISRMIRDFSAPDIVAGSKKTNLRQMVEQRVAAAGKPVSEIRYREISTREVDVKSLRMRAHVYRTAMSCEHFLEWVDGDGRIAGFLRLSLPDDAYLRDTPGLPASPGEAMIREVHVYGRAAKLHESESGAAQHAGLGKQLIACACERARDAGYHAVNVISAVGTRAYYRSLGFADADLYQRLPLP